MTIVDNRALAKGTKLTAKHYRRHRRLLVEKGSIKKDYSPSTRNNLEGISLR